MTNGINNRVHLRMAGGGIGISDERESNVFFGDPTGAIEIDFAGYNINSISLLVNRLNIDTPGRDPNKDGIWTDVIFNAKVTVNAVPAPTTLLLLGTGLAGIFVTKRRFRR